MDCMFYEAFAEEAADLRARVPTEWSVGFSADTIQESGDVDPPAPVISMRTQSVIPSAWRGRLRGVLTRSAGYDHLADWARGPEAPVCGYLPEYCVRAVAEQALLLWLALLRRLPRQQAQVHTFERDGLTGGEMGGRRLVVVGVGRIGSEIMRLGQAVGLDVLGVDLVPQPDVFPYAAFSEALPTADILVCAMNLTADNHGYFNAHALAAAKRGLIFVNVARGELAVEADLLRLLEAGRLGGVGLDVYGAEPDLAVALRQGRTSTRCALFHELAARPDVIMTPHNAFNTAEAVARKAEQSIMQLVTLASQGTFRWPVPIS